LLCYSISFGRKALVVGFTKVMGFAPQLDGFERAARHLNMVKIMRAIGMVNFLLSKYCIFSSANEGI
jgi:hypothetical protein